MTPRYRLRTLLILLAVLPPILWFGWGKYQAWKAKRELAEAWEAARRTDPDITYNTWLIWRKVAEEWERYPATLNRP